MHHVWKITAALSVLAALVVALASSTGAPAAAATSVAAAQTACGTVDLASASSADADAAFGCFAKAFASCNFATLMTTSSTTNVTSTFTTYAGDNGCNVSETVSHPMGTDATVDSYVCSGVNQDGDALHLTGCGAQKDVWLRLSKG
jgi:hypothetical protein